MPSTPSKIFIKTSYKGTLMSQSKHLFCGALLFSMCAALAGETGNLLRNGDFESRGSDGLPTGWYVLDGGAGPGSSYKNHNIHFQADPNIVRTGHYSAAMIHSAPEYPAWVMLRQDLHLAPGDYVLAGYAFWPRRSFARPCVALHLIDRKGGLEHPLIFQIWNKAASPDWVPFWGTFTVKPDVQTVGVNILATDGPAQAYVDDVGVYRLQDAPPKPQSPEAVLPPAPIPATPGHPGIAGLDASGRVELVEVNGVWYFKSPQGRAFFDLGVNHFSYPAANSWWDQLNPDRGVKVRKRWPTEAQWQDDALNALKDWGFTSLGAWSWEGAYGKAGGRGILPWVIFGFNTADENAYLLKDRNGSAIPVGGTSRMADPFEPRWRDAISAQVRSTLEGKNPSRIMGYFPENEISLGVVPLYAYAGTPAAKAAMCRWLTQRHGTVAKLNQAWSEGTAAFTYASFEAVVASLPDLTSAHEHSALMKDMEAFEDFMVETYVNAVVATIRQYAPNGIICSPRLPGEGLCDYKPLRHFKKFDIIAVNCYGGESYSSRQIESLKKIHAVTGRPVLITEWTVGTNDAIHDGEHQANVYIDMEKQLSNLPFVVGMHWQMWFSPAEGGNNFGLVDNDDSPYSPAFIAKVAAFQKNGFGAPSKQISPPKGGP
jgi:hypothetical protein